MLRLFLPEIRGYVISDRMIFFVLEYSFLEIRIFAYLHAFVASKSLSSLLQFTEPFAFIPKRHLSIIFRIQSLLQQPFKQPAYLDYC